MSTYIMSDIHGCYQEFLCMLDNIGFSDSDRLILAGDYIDRGPDTYEMLKWMENCPDNVCLLRGNHEEEFAENVSLMCILNEKEGLKSDAASNEDTAALYASVKYFLAKSRLSLLYFDLYGTMNRLIRHSKVTLYDLSRWAELIRRMPYCYELKVRGRDCVVVHAGYAEREEEVAVKYSSLERFYLYAREDAFLLGGKRHGMIIAGHTPTIVKGDFVYNEGHAFRYYDVKKDCIFYDIDCGCVFRRREPIAKLACLRLEDEKLFYV